MSRLVVLADCCTIQLTQNQNTLVDVQDWVELSRLRWFAWWSPCTKSFYARRSVNFIRESDQKRSCNVISLHGAVIEKARGSLLGRLTVDHRNMDTLDNRRSNIRPATRSENKQNSRTHSRKNQGSGRPIKGVYQRGNKWRAAIRVDKKLRQLGTFDSDVDAARAYDKVALEMFGEFARTNNV